MDLDKNKLYIDLLPRQLINKNLTEGYDCNYEIYLTELINNSKFIKDYNEKFIFNKEQSHGECDISNFYYSLDFKLFVDTKLMENISLLSSQYIVSKDKSTVIFCGSKKSGTGIGYNLLKVLRSYKYEDIIRIANSNAHNINEQSEKSLVKLLKNCEKDKNLFFYLPYKIYFKDKIVDEKIASFIIDCIYSDIKNILKYRKNKVNKDTYISFITDNHLVIAKERNEKLELYDIVSLECSEKYKEIMELTSTWC